MIGTKTKNQIIELITILEKDSVNELAKSLIKRLNVILYDIDELQKSDTKSTQNLKDDINSLYKFPHVSLSDYYNPHASREDNLYFSKLQSEITNALRQI